MNHNLEKIPGYSIILCDVGLSMTFPCSQSMYQGKPRLSIDFIFDFNFFFFFFFFFLFVKK